MMKKNKLYTVNKFNKPMFMPEENIFDGFHPVGSQMTFGSGISPDVLGGYKTTAPGMSPQIDWTNGVQRAAVLGTTKGLTEGFSDIANFNNPFAATSSTGSKGGSWLGLSKADNPFSKQNLKAAFGKEGLGNIAKGLGTGLISAGAGMLGNIAGNAISGGLSSTAGNAIGSLGSTIGGAVGMVNPLAGAAVTFASNLVGGTVNRAFGTKVDEAKRNQVNADISKLNSFTSNAGSFDEIQGPEAVSMDTDVYEGGWFNDVSGKNEELKRRLIAAKSFADRSVDNNIFNLTSNQLNDALANYAAFGGPIDTSMDGAIGYGFMLDYLLSKNKTAENKTKMTNMFMRMPDSMFAFGGDMQTNSADFPTGLTHIGAGGSHEENPNDGVQMGVDNEGTPNLVEEGETVYNDYVFSNRILADEATKKMFHLPKKKDITFAEISKRLEKEISERPNDPISKAGFKAQMQTLEEQQERQKSEMEAERARAAFEALSPEEQTAVMQNAAQQKAMAQQAAEEQAIAEQQAMQAEPSFEEMLAKQQAQVAALGGRLIKASDVTEEDANMFAVGGRKARKAAKRYNKDWFLAQAKSLGMIDDDATDIEGWEFNPNDPDANLSTFNNKYRDFQKKKALETYRTGQRKSKENELFGSNGLYRYSDDKSKIFKARTNDKDRIGWINADYTGAIDDNGNLKGFLSQEDYNKLSDKDKEAYKRINERAGDKMYDFRGKAIEDIYNGNVDEILGAYNYDDGFKWNDKEAQTLQYPVGMERSNLSYLRYAPALGGAIGLAYDMLNPADYSNAEAVEKSGSIVPMFVHPNYNPTYMKPHVFDVWQQRNRNAANLNSAIRTFENTNNPNKSANILAALYNATNLDGQLGIDADKYNREDAFKVAAHNSGENKTLAQLDMQAQLANQRVYDDAQRLGFQGRLYGARMRDDIDARRAASLSANATNLLQSIGNIGEEAYDEDRLKWLEGTGVLRSDYFNKGKYSAAKGGKLKKKKGLTY